MTSLYLDALSASVVLELLSVFLPPTSYFLFPLFAFFKYSAIGRLIFGTQQLNGLFHTTGSYSYTNNNEQNCDNVEFLLAHSKRKVASQKVASGSTLATKQFVCHPLTHFHGIGQLNLFKID